MIPDWNISEVLPPVRPGAAGHSMDRSPYKASLSEVVERLGKSSARLQILRGLLAYRAELRKRGITKGFQWLDGSFTENKELLSLEPPNDVDVVTFFYLPDGMDQSSFAQVFADLFDTDNTKKLYKVDAYGQPLGVALKEMDVVIISYWHSMWSHTRNRICPLTHG